MRRLFSRDHVRRLLVCLALLPSSLLPACSDDSGDGGDGGEISDTTADDASGSGADGIDSAGDAAEAGEDAIDAEGTADSADAAPVDDVTPDADAVTVLPDAESRDAGDAGPDPADPAPRIGVFQIRLIAPVEQTAGFAVVVGKVYDGPTPAPVIWEESMSDGLCRLLTPRVPFCPEPCGGGALCVEDGQCESYPKAQSVGTVKVEGVQTTGGDDSFSMTPLGNTYLLPAGVQLPFPPFAEGDEVKLSASGSDFAPAFAIAAHGVAPLEGVTADIQLEPGQPLALEWSAAGQADISTVHVEIDISHHGGTKGVIECEAPDDGALEVSAALIDALLDLGSAGFPKLIATRRSSGSAELAAGPVELAITSEVERDVSIPGLVSCTSDDDCPAGQSCQSDLSCG